MGYGSTTEAATAQGSENLSKRLRRATAPLMIPDGVVRFIEQRTFSAKELADNVLNIDQTYQRIEIKPKVWEIAAAIQAGGAIPDPIWVVRRSDGTYWILDGQQRYWACWHLNHPLVALVHKVKGGVEAEATIFHVLNDRKGLSAPHRAYTWPNASGPFLRWVNENNASPFMGEVSTKAGGGRRLPATTLAKGLLAALGGGNAGRAAHIKSVMQKLDKLVVHAPARVQKTREMFLVVLRNVCPEGPIVSLVPRAIGAVCYDRWSDLPMRAAWPTPSHREYKRLANVAWAGLAPTQEHKYFVLYKEAVDDRWQSKAG